MRIVVRIRHTVQVSEMSKRTSLLVAITMSWVAISGAQADLPQIRALKPVSDTDFRDSNQYSKQRIRLGQLLFFDKVLSGNRNIACATCHHPSHGSGDGIALSLGEGARGLAGQRRTVSEHPVHGRTPRNAQPLYFLGAKSFTALFHDGRVEVDSHRTWRSGFWSPARDQLPPGLDNVLAAQAMFPLISNIEMAGIRGENAVADAVARDELAGEHGAWMVLARRLQAIPDYVQLFKAAFTDIKKAEQITLVHAANAIAAFEATAFRADDSPFDRYLRTRDRRHLSSTQWRGLTLFYGKAGCAHCHSGHLQTDQKYHAIAMVQIGPGQGDGHDDSYWQSSGFPVQVEDFGRGRVTHRHDDRYRFRTPSLRNVELTGPWGHSGAYSTLEAIVRHHLNPIQSLHRFDIADVKLPPLRYVNELRGRASSYVTRTIRDKRLKAFQLRDVWVQRTRHLRIALASASNLQPRHLDDGEVSDLVTFLKALTDPASRDQSHLIPKRVPSGIPIDD